VKRYAVAITVAAAVTVIVIGSDLAEVVASAQESAERPAGWFPYPEANGGTE